METEIQIEPTSGELARVCTRYPDDQGRGLLDAWFGPPPVGRPYRSADGFDNPVPRAASALVELAMTCPGLYTRATSWLPNAENYRHHLLHNLRPKLRLVPFSL